MKIQLTIFRDSHNSTTDGTKIELSRGDAADKLRLQLTDSDREIEVQADDVLAAVKALFPQLLKDGGWW